MSMRRSAVAVTLAVLSCLVPPPARATQKFGPIQLSGNLRSMNIVRTPDQDTYEFIMNRNVAHIHLDYDWIQSGKFYNNYDIPSIDTSHLSVIWRGVYDSIYDTTPGFIQKEDIHGRAYGNRMTLDEYRKLLGLPRSVLEVSGLSRGERDALKFDNQLREFYIDLKFRNVPLSVRAGRQQIVWGETDNFRMLDRANTLDLTWHFTQEIPGPATYGWDELRRPFWMFKFLYEVGDVWRLSQNFLEWYWNPGDWYPAKQAFMPRPWGPSSRPTTSTTGGPATTAPTTRRCAGSPRPRPTASARKNSSRRGSSPPSSSRPTSTPSAPRATTRTRRSRRPCSATRPSTTSASRSSTSRRRPRSTVPP